MVPAPVWRLGALAAAISAAAASGLAGEADLEAVVARMEAPTARGRVAALRDLTRLQPPPARARPLLEKLLKDHAPEVRGAVVRATAEILGPGGVDLLERLYCDDDRMVRGAAIRAACRMWDDDPARRLCAGAFSDPDPLLRAEVLTVLRDRFPRDPAAAALFRQGLGDPVEFVQRAAVFGAQAARDPQAIAALARLPATASDLVAEPAVAEALATIGTTEAVGALIKLLRPQGPPPARPSERVRAAAVRGLERTRDRRALPHLRAALRDPSALVRATAINALMELRDRSAAQSITVHLRDGDLRVRVFALRALRRIGEPAAADHVRQVLAGDEDSSVRAMAATTLADLLGPRSIPDLSRVRDDVAPEVRLEAAGALAGLGPPAAEALVAFVRDAHPDVRRMAIRGLGQIGGPVSIPALTSVADPEQTTPSVRIAVAEALGALRRPEGLETVIRLADDAEASVRQAAAAALGAIGGPRAQRVLERLMNDAAPGVRNTARRALGELHARQR